VIINGTKHKMSVTIAAATPPTAPTEPIDRSIPSVKITNVIPTAKMPMTAIESAMLIKFSNDRKCGAIAAKTIASSRIAPRITNPLNLCRHSVLIWRCLHQRF
ncbi:MAG: hypothetical protein ABI891_02340, partial [Acidobacteriota bacterium]